MELIMLILLAQHTGQVKWVCVPQAGDTPWGHRAFLLPWPFVNSLSLHNNKPLTNWLLLCFDVKISTGLSLLILLKISIFVGRSLSEQCRERVKFIRVVGFSRETESVRGGSREFTQNRLWWVQGRKPQDLQGESASWRPRRGDGLVSVRRLAGLTPRKSQCFSLKAVRQEKLSLTERVGFLVYAYLQLIRSSPPTLGRAFCFTQSTC